MAPGRDQENRKDARIVFLDKYNRRETISFVLPKSDLRGDIGADKFNTNGVPNWMAVSVKTFADFDVMCHNFVTPLEVRSTEHNKVRIAGK
jgi:hypothetical protein